MGVSSSISTQGQSETSSAEMELGPPGVGVSSSISTQVQSETPLAEVELGPPGVGVSSSISTQGQSETSSAEEELGPPWRAGGQMSEKPHSAREAVTFLTQHISQPTDARQ